LTRTRTQAHILDVTKNGTPLVGRPVLDRVILHAERFVLIRSFLPFDSLKDKDACSVGLALSGLGGTANLPKRRLKPISHGRMSRSAISVSKHCSRILGLKTGGSSLRPSGNTRLPGTGLNNIPRLVMPPMSCGGFSHSVIQMILP
jgi:hypothetical protein